MSNKTIFILGAGFSMPAGAPKQTELLGGILNYEGQDFGNPIFEWQTEIAAFLGSIFTVEKDKLKDISLEDIYTPLDKCISENVSLKGYSTDYLKEIQVKLNSLIAIFLNDRIVSSGKSKKHIGDFVSKLVQQKKDAPTTDKFAIISTNWDIILDNEIFRQIDQRKGAIDYGCQITGIDNNNRIIPPLVAKAKGYYTVKLLKIHGSLNWLNCPNCNRIFASKSEKIAIPNEFYQQSCKICSKQSYDREEQKVGIQLEPNIILPTFLKSFDNFQYKLIWDQAAKELSEATKIIFMGYSFPQADFDFRQLLARFTPSTCDVEVVLYSEDGSGPKRNTPEYWQSTEYRYSSFFGQRLQGVVYEGVESYIKQLNI